MRLLAQAESAEGVSSIWSRMVQECVEETLHILCNAQCVQLRMMMQQ